MIARIRARLAAVSLMVMVFAMAAVPALATPTHGEQVGTIFETSVGEFVDLVLDLAPYLFGGLVTVLLIRLAIRWFQRVTSSV